MYPYFSVLWTSACLVLLGEFLQGDEFLRDVSVKAAPVQLTLVFLTSKMEQDDTWGKSESLPRPLVMPCSCLTWFPPRKTLGHVGILRPNHWCCLHFAPGCFRGTENTITFLYTFLCFFVI